jgi:hypothetical protein
MGQFNMNNDALSSDSLKCVNDALTYTRGGCPLPAAGIISSLIKRIHDLEGVTYGNDSYRD